MRRAGVAARAGQPAGVAVDGEQADALAGPGGDEDQVGGGAVDHEALRAGQRPAVTLLRRLQRDAGLVPLARRLGEGEGGDRLARRDAGEVVTLGGFVTAVDQRVGGQHDGREVGGAQQGPAHLLEHHAQLDVGVTRAAELLRDDEALEAELLAHLLPDGGVEALFGVHQAPDLGLGRLLVKE
jgi:hypothetical protein